MKSSPEILKKLSNLEIFLDFTHDTAENIRILEEVCNCLEIVDFAKGDIIIKEGDYGDSLYILYEGSVQVIRNTPHNERFAVVNLDAGMNVFFGEVALIDRDKRSASVAALSDCRTFKLTGNRFLELAEKEPKLAFRTTYRIAKRLASSLRHANSDIITLYQALLDEIGA